ncbi:hypothetical protein MD484_g7907, partial [Candolleomyces efflorescens]
MAISFWLVTSKAKNFAATVFLPYLFAGAPVFRLQSGDSNYIIVYNPSTGVDIYEMPGLPDSLPVQTFPFLRSLRKLSLVASAKDGEITVHGEPDGRMNVFSQRTGLRIAALQVDSPFSFKQTISARVIEDRTILAAGCMINGQVTVKLWENAPPAPAPPAPPLAPTTVPVHISVITRVMGALRVILFGALSILLLFSGVAAGTALFLALTQKYAGSIFRYPL